MKIGIILDSTKVSWYLNDLVEWIKKDPSLNLEVLLIQNIKSKKKSLFNESSPKQKKHYDKRYLCLQTHIFSCSLI